MKLSYLTLSFIILLNMNCSAQDDEPDHIAINNSRIKRMAVKIAISNFATASEALLPIGVEYRFGKVVSAGAELGIPLFFNVFSYKNDSGPQKKLYGDIRYRADLRFYFVSDAENAGYIGLDGTLRNQKYKITDGEYYDRSGYKLHFSSADIAKTVYTCNIIIGTQANISRKVFIELQSGLGLKVVEVMRTNVAGLHRRTVPFTNHIDIPVGRGEDRIEKESMIVNFPFALKICFRV